MGIFLYFSRLLKQIQVDVALLILYYLGPPRPRPHVKAIRGFVEKTPASSQQDWLEAECFGALLARTGAGRSMTETLRIHAADKDDGLCKRFAKNSVVLPRLDRPFIRFQKF